MAGEGDASIAKQRVRTISSLTQEQIRKKRDTDRKAQRAYRQRTNIRIQELEEQLAALKAEKSQDNAAALEINELRQANEALKHQLRTVAAMTGTVTLLDVDRENSIRSFRSTADYAASPSLSIELPPLAKQSIPTHTLASAHEQNSQREPHSYIAGDHLLYSLELAEVQTCDPTVDHPVPAERWSFAEHPDSAVEKGCHR